MSNTSAEERIARHETTINPANACRCCGKPLLQIQIDSGLGNPQYNEWYREGYCSFVCFQFQGNATVETGSKPNLGDVGAVARVDQVPRKARTVEQGDEGRKKPSGNATEAVLNRRIPAVLRSLARAIIGLVACVFGSIFGAIILAVIKHKLAVIKHEPLKPFTAEFMIDAGEFGFGLWLFITLGGIFIKKFKK